ncbi:MAG: TolC family protein [Verrucomicrobia bacterium]|nr:TolC family protein [Verrucomicrobiota bacterium]
MGYDLALDDGALKELSSAALLSVEIGEEQGYDLAAARRLDLLNEIDRFEDAKRKVFVSRDRLRPGLLFTANTALNSDGVNYAKFEWNKSTASAGLQLDLPFDRVSERNIYRTSLISFERELRTLGIALDTMRESVRSGLRSLEAVMQNYEIQKRALQLADRRVDAANLLLSAGRAQVRDQLEAQTAQVQAQNAVTQALVDYLAARLKLLIDLGALDVDQEKFWLKPAKLPGVQPKAKPAAKPQDQEVLPPEKIFAKP